MEYIEELEFTIRKKIWHTRKIIILPAHLLPGIFLILVGYAGCDFVLANVFLFFALGFNGAALISNLSNNQDLAPNFAGFLYGIMNTIGTTSGMIIPPIVEEIAGRYGVSVLNLLLRFDLLINFCLFFD